MQTKLNEKQKAECLAMIDMGHSQATIAKTYGVDPAMICRLKKEYLKYREQGLEAPHEQDIATIKQGIANQCSKAVAIIMDAITPEKAEKAGIKDLAISYGIFADKMALALGLSTQNIAVKTDIVSAIRSVSSK